MTEKNYEYKSFTFPNDYLGIQEKESTVNKLLTEGWQLVNESITEQQYEGGKGCCLAILCLPLALLAFKKGTITVRLKREIVELN